MLRLWRFTYVIFKWSCEVETCASQEISEEELSRSLSSHPSRSNLPHDEAERHESSALEAEIARECLAFLRPGVKGQYEPGRDGRRAEAAKVRDSPLPGRAVDWAYSLRELSWQSPSLVFLIVGRFWCIVHV